MVPIIQKVIEEEAPTKPQEDHGMNKLIVFDPSDFQRTFLSTFLISPFVWNKTRAVELSRHEMGMKHVVFEPGGKLCSLRKKNQLIEKESDAATFDFVNFSTSEDKVLHASAQQEFHYETNWKRLPTLSWFQQTRKRSKWPPDHQDITRLAKHIGLNSFREMSMSDWVGRLQTYLWRPGAYVSIFIFLGEHSVRSRIILGNNELEADQNSLLLGHIKIWKPPDMQQLQHHYRDYQTMSGDGGFTGENGEVIPGSGEELIFSSQIKEKPPDQHSLQQTPKQPIQGQTILRSTLFKKRSYNNQSTSDEFLAKLGMQQENLGSCLAARLDIGSVRGSYLNNHKELSNETNCSGNLTHQGLTSNWNHVQSFSGERVMGSTSQFIKSQSYLWRPGEYARNKHEEDNRFKPPDLNKKQHVPGFILIKEAPPDAAYNPKLSKNRFGIRLLLFDKFSFANLLCFNEFKSGFRYASGVWRTQQISPFSITEP
ncbi:unnamed protein product, partial [Brassica oleracea]